MAALPFPIAISLAFALIRFCLLIAFFLKIADTRFPTPPTTPPTAVPIPGRIAEPTEAPLAAPPRALPAISAPDPSSVKPCKPAPNIEAISKP